MKFLFILLFLCPVWCYASDVLPQEQGAGASAAQSSSRTIPKSGQAANSGTKSTASLDPDARKAREIVNQGIEALGGDEYLHMQNFEQQGRTYAFHHGRPSGEGALFWSFFDFPDKERVEYTQQRDVARVFLGDKGYEITYRGVHPVEETDMVDYRRQRRFALDTVLRTWVNDPEVIFLYEGTAIAAQHAAEQVTLINEKNEAVTLDFDAQSHLPVRKAFEWRDPVDRQKNLEEEVYENYRRVFDVMMPFNVTRFFNGDMSRERFLFTVTINQALDQAMFDPNSGYNPNKSEKKAKR